MARQPVNKPRLQIFVSDLSATGVVRNAVAIANAAASAGYEVRLLTCRSDGALRNEVASDIEVVSLIGACDAHRSRSSQMRRALPAYRRHSRDWRPDILFSAGNHTHLISTIAWVGLPGRKVLRISNDLNHGSPPIMTRLRRGLKFRLELRLADRLVIVSQRLSNEPLLARQRVGGKAIVIPNGVDVQAVRSAAMGECPHPWAKNPSVPIVLAVGRHAPQKNFPVLLAAFAGARRERAMRLILLGRGTSASTQGLRDEAAKSSVSDDVDFVAPTSNPFAYMSAASVLALPSLWEGSANVLLEAMACGTPVIASRTAGDAEYVLGFGRYGLLVDANDVDGLSRALLLQTGDSPTLPGDQSERFDRHETMRQYVSLFDELTGHHVRQHEHPATELPPAPLKAVR